MNSKTRRSGFTLIEILIAVSLVGLLSLAMMFAIRIALNAQARANARLFDNRVVMGTQRALEQELNGFIPQAALYFPADTQGPGEQVPFFEGEPGQMRFISSYSLNGADRGLPQILEFAVIPGDPGQGFRLIVNEIPWHGPASAGSFIVGMEPSPTGARHPVFAPVQIGAHSFVLADRLAFCRMIYLGRNQQVTPPRDEWRQAWTDSVWPLAVRVEMAPLPGEDSAKLHTVTVTAPIHATRDLGGYYGDSQ